MDARVDFEITDRDAYRTAMDTLNRRSQPPAILRALMNAFEAYRAARKIGWSRPWNKYGVRNFQSYRLDFKLDGVFVDDARTMLASPALALDDKSRAFVNDLLEDSPEARAQLMGFLFFHEVDVPGGLREGVVLSLGRINTRRRHRDRLDINFSADVEGDAVSPPRYVTVYVDPYEGTGPPLFEASLPIDAVASAPAVFDRLKACYGAWGRDDPRLWDHWTAQYIDYFAPRTRPAAESHFPETPFEAAWRETRGRQ